MPGSGHDPCGWSISSSSRESDRRNAASFSLLIGRTLGVTAMSAGHFANATSLRLRAAPSALQSLHRNDLQSSIPDISFALPGAGLSPGAAVQTSTAAPHPAPDS